MSKSLVAGMALSAALTAQAQAPKAPVVCTENQTNVVSMVEGVIGCKDITPRKAYTHTSAPTVALGSETTQETSDNTRANAAIEKNAQLELTGVRDNRYGNGAEVTIGVGGADLAGGLMLQKLENAKQALIAVSNKINSNLAISAGIGTRSESAQVGLDDTSLNSTDLSAENIFFRIDAKFLESLGLNRAAIAYIHTKVGSNTVKDETLAWTEESVIDTPTLTRYITEYYEQHRTVQFRGLDTNKLLANAVFYIGKNGEVTLQLGVMERDGQGTTGVVGATGKYYTSIGGVPVVPYLGGGKSITGNQNHQNIGVRAALSEHISVGLERSQYSGASGKQYDTRASVMFSLQPNTSQFVRADVSAPLNASTIVTEILRSPEYRIRSVADQGKMEEIVTTPKKMSQSVRDVAKEVKEKPKPKPTPEPEPIDPEAPVITLTGASTVTLTVGDTWTDPGATCVDNKDTACTVVVSGSVDINTVGTYTITYTATDSAGNKSTKEREVEVVAVADPAPVSAPIPNISTTDNAGIVPIVLSLPIVIDSLSRPVTCIAENLPSGLTLVDNNTISGIHDSSGGTPINATRKCDAGNSGNPLTQPIIGYIDDIG